MSQRHSPAADRNREPLSKVLERELPPRGLVLELASGTGQHVVYFAQRLSSHVFQPSDPSAEARESVEAYRAAHALENVRPVLAIDVLSPGWEAPFVGVVDAIVCINMVQVAPKEASRALFEGARRILGERGAASPLVLYGPYRFGGKFLAESNAAFDASLRERNPAWGVRDADELAEEARAAGLVASPPIAMPAQNHVLVFRPAARASAGPSDR